MSFLLSISFSWPSGCGSSSLVVAGGCGSAEASSTGKGDLPSASLSAEISSPSCIFFSPSGFSSCTVISSLLSSVMEQRVSSTIVSILSPSSPPLSSSSRPSLTSSTSVPFTMPPSSMPSVSLPELASRRSPSSSLAPFITTLLAAIGDREPSKMSSLLSVLPKVSLLFPCLLGLFL